MRLTQTQIYLKFVEIILKKKRSLPFLFVAGKQDVVILESKIPESIVFQGEQTDEKYVVNYSTRKDYIQSIYKPKAKLVTNPELDITHLYCHAEAQSFVDDYLQTDFNSSQISAGFNPLNEEYTYYFPKCVEYFSKTPSEVVDEVSSWINRVPLVGSLLKISSDNASDIFKFNPPNPDSIRRGQSTTTIDRYVVVGSELDSPDDNTRLFLNPGLGSDLISTTLNYEQWLSRDTTTRWRNSLDEGRFAIQLRVVTYPSFIAERIILNYSTSNCEKFLRSLNFSYKIIDPQYYLLCLGNYYRNIRNSRRIRIIVKKLAPVTLAINYGHEIMDYLQSKSILIGTLPKIHQVITKPSL